MERKGEQVKLKIFAVPFRSRAEPAERSIFRVVGGLRYRIWWEETASGWSLKCSLSFDLLQTFSFFMTGRRNRAHAPSRFLPPRPSLPSGFIFGSKNGIERIFSLSKQPQNSVRTSLVPLSICLWEIRAYSFGFLEAATAKEVEEAGEKTSAFEMVSPPRKQ